MAGDGAPHPEAPQHARAVGGMKSDETRAGPSARGGSFEGRGATSESDNKVFSFGIGGFSQGHPLEIRGGRRRLLLPPQRFASPDTEERRGTLDKSKVDAPMASPCDLGAYGWLDSYWSPVLDGEQWILFDGRGSHEGSNAYPKGFERLLGYMADEFGCEEMRPRPGDTYDGPTETEGLA